MLVEESFLGFVHFKTREKIKDFWWFVFLLVFFLLLYILDVACLKNLIYFMVSRCDSYDKSTGPLEAEVIPVLHYVADGNTSDESDGVAKQEDEQIGIFRF